ncbi:hypothetical protein CR513_22284, partial [Mucuna pruriens]
MDYVKKCDKCWRFAEIHKAPPKHLHLVTSPWPFYKWGVDILGPFPVAPSQVFDSSNRLLHQMDGSGPEHPQSNGQAEVTNKVILRGLQKRLEEAKGRWAEELQ